MKKPCPGACEFFVELMFKDCSDRTGQGNINLDFAYMFNKCSIYEYLM